MDENADRLGQEAQLRLRAERSLRESEERLRRVFEHSNDAILVIDPEADRILMANPRAAAMLGYGPDELIAAVKISAIHPNERPQLQAFTDGVRARGTGWTNELSCTRKDGARLPAEIAASVAAFEGRNCIIAVVRDVSERKAAQEALERSERRFRAFVENAGDGFFLVGQDGRIADVNPRACQMLGYGAEELIGRAVLDIDIGLSPAALAELTASLTPDQPRVIESRHRRKDGTSFPSEVSLCRFGTPSAPQYIALVRDVTQRRAGEAALARLAELGQFTAMITHQVRNPLATIVMCLDYFARQGLPDPAARRLTLAQGEAERLERLLAEILAYAGEPSLHLESIDLRELIETLLPALQAIPVVATRRLRLTEAPGEGPRIQADRDQLAQALTNLVVNACEAVGPEDEVALRVGGPSGPSGPWVEVRNPGAPIPAETLARIGTPFFTTKPQGTGLGIAYVRRVAAAHGWRLELRSCAEQGTRARLWL
ncbi:MAG: PAS domain S-box protein [Chromatiaceae bacterium]|jgi:PAS domain S-box-containing protein|nr:PAS domain S-box protein [Chromatiaceae bacterium]